MCPCNLQHKKHRDGNVPATCRTKNITMEMSLQLAARKTSRWKYSCNLQHKKHRDGCVPAKTECKKHLSFFHPVTLFGDRFSYK